MPLCVWSCTTIADQLNDENADCEQHQASVHQFLNTDTVPADKSDCQADYWLRISPMKHKQIVLEDEQW